MKDPEIFVDNPAGQPDYFDLPNKVLGDDKIITGQTVVNLLLILENNARALATGVSNLAINDPEDVERGAKDLAQLIENYRTAMMVAMEERFPSPHSSNALH